MKRILAISVLTLRESLRSGAAAALFGLTLAIAGWLALTIQGDGTLAGQIRVFIRYAAGATTAILGLATLWLAAGRIASEIDDRTMQTLAVKPVHAIEVWLGKWLGMVILNAAFLAVAGTVIACGAFLVLHYSGDYDAAKRDDARRHSLVCRTPLAPISDRHQAHAATSEDHDREPADEGSPHAQVARQVVPPGGSRVWTFELPPGASGPLWVQFTFDYGSSDRIPMSGSWSLSSYGATNAFWSAAVSNLAAGRHSMEVRAATPISGKLTLRFSAAPAPETGVVVFRQESGAILLEGESSTASHLFRALLIALLKLSLLAAAGLTSSALFSTPVATFVATSLAIMTICIQYFLSVPDAEKTAHSCGHDHGSEAAAAVAWYEAAADSVTRAAAVVVQPIHSMDGLALVADGLEVPWSLVGRAAFVLLGGYVLILGAIGAIALRRRELADV